MSNAICVCVTADGFGPHLDTWRNEKVDNDDKFLIVDVTSNLEFDKGDFNFTEFDLRNNLNFNIEVSNKNFWNSHGNRNIAWFYAHLRMLNFYLKFPNYDYYWFFDDDIFMDDWNMFFNSLSEDDSDFLSYFCFKKNGVESQVDVPFIDNKSYSGQSWFQRFPGHGDIMSQEVKEYFGSFFPTTRFSNRALKILLEENKKGYSAYHEGFVPTILNHHGQKLKTIIQPDNTSKFFDVDKVNIIHKNIRVTWEWL
jgi:hypothetical protein